MEFKYQLGQVLAHRGQVHCSHLTEPLPLLVIEQVLRRGEDGDSRSYVVSHSPSWPSHGQLQRAEVMELEVEPYPERPAKK